MRCVCQQPTGQPDLFTQPEVERECPKTCLVAWACDRSASEN